ncbi:subclass B1 metallo-beta-lactamase [Erythrobacter litoralis]|uniref:beta-lactamase n=1 Tax=Erythrobacter litoralis (strain HTCC2594) TaxID=314225 RepID=Q2N9N3_ERYLH|nr:subclass B1 metallo-beta-lactamase [Erythrobacter litoralis]ABC63608.1 beta-lactamase II [Erythrobacter litoralis HTCC2594]
MIARVLALAAALALPACVPGEIRSSVAEQEADRDIIRFGEVSFSQLAEGVWMHTTYLDLMGFGPIPSNGLLVVNGDNTILVDTAWTDEQTEQIVAWASMVLAKPVRAAVVTHAHQDKMGGMAALHGANIATWAHPLSNELAPEEGLVPARNAITFDANGWATGEAAQSLAPLRLYYPGGAHTRDNITVGLPELGIAFGGCMIKAGDASNLGNLADADTAAYAQSVRNFAAAFPDARTIAMSHSPPEGRKAIERTLDLAEEL